jgi:hypothetical protein
MFSDFLHVLNSARKFYTKKSIVLEAQIIFYNLFTTGTEIKL